MSEQLKDLQLPLEVPLSTNIQQDNTVLSETNIVNVKQETTVLVETNINQVSLSINNNNENSNNHIEIHSAKIILINEAKFFQDLYPYVMKMLDAKKNYICFWAGRRF